MADAEMIERLLDGTATMQTARTAEAVAELVVETATEAFGLQSGICWLYDPDADRLEPAAATADPEPGALSPGDDGYDAFVEGSLGRFAGVESAPVMAGLWLPLGDHGIAAVGEDRGGDDERHEQLSTARLLAEHATRALDRLARERDRREREQHLRVIAEHIDESVYLVTPDYSEVLYVGPAYEEIWGRRTDELYENPLLYLEGIDPRDREKVRAGTEMIMEDLERGAFGKEYWIEFRVRRPDGEIRWVYSSGTTAELPDGKTVFVASAKDITERKRHEQRLEVFNRVLRHNLRNQLDVIRSHAEVLTAVDDEHAGEILATVDSLAAMGDRARTIDRFMSRELRETEVDLVRLIQETVTAVDRGDTGVDVALEGPAEAPLVSDRAALEATLESAVENAFAYADSTVEVTVAESPHGATIAIADDGPGIPEEELTSLDAGTERPLQHGRGLGLWQLKWGVEKLGGELEFETGDGTTVRIAVPDLAASDG